MDAGLLSVLVVGFILGIKGGMEPDHVVAVSTIASQSKKLSKASLAGVFWGIGHTTTLFIVGFVLIMMKGQITDTWALSLEFVVGIMMVYLGLTNITSIRKEKVHAHTHYHDGKVHSHFYSDKNKESHDYKHVSYRKSLIIGLIHGLAGSAAMVLLTIASVDTLWQGAIYLIIYGVGTMFGMFLVTSFISIPFVLSVKKVKINHFIIRLAGVASLAYGLVIMYNIGITEELIKNWIK
ncbi:sulfite exporter TauE/SafE family protein [Aquibacillus salsiterrae]|uniref:Sulfite exporter TauE/SafE family protein n=1 Tax=Aquibacillus salsiterrae TaxID=2950439 RepID=A0A9X3WDA1_9BACI|nr:sulfite exporter TauE/SafE family protein [Aquibacillus salsiterrae]MDC3417755.1 sulfite exporter TauE/SafE family protein [Aquibacillus salsiterrae]